MENEVEILKERLSDDVKFNILAFLGKETYTNKITNMIHTRFIKTHPFFTQLSNLFSKVVCEKFKVYQTGDTYEIIIYTSKSVRSCISTTIFYNQYKFHNGYPLDILKGIDPITHCVMQINEEICIYKLPSKEEKKRTKSLYTKYQCVPVLKSEPGVDPPVNNSFWASNLFR